MAEDNEYEKERAEQIARNEALMLSLGLHEAGKSVAEVLEVVEKEKEVVIASPSGPTRRSSRVARTSTKTVADWSSGEDEGGRKQTRTRGHDKQDSESADSKSDKEEEYRPLREEVDPEDESAGEDDEAEREQETTPKKRRGKVVVKVKKRVRQNDQFIVQGEDPDEDELALQQAIALSLSSAVGQPSVRSQHTSATKVSVNDRLTTTRGKAPQGGEASPSGKELNPSEGYQENGRGSQGKGIRRRKKKAAGAPPNEEEMDSLFFIFDDRERGQVSVRQLLLVAEAHDFSFTEEEAHDMIHFYDIDGDAKLSQEEFKAMIARCGVVLT